MAKQTVNTGDWIFVKTEKGGGPNSVASRNLMGMKSHLKSTVTLYVTYCKNKKTVKAEKRFVMKTSPAPRDIHQAINRIPFSLLR
jgi:hypothetical protein